MCNCERGERTASEGISAAFGMSLFRSARAVPRSLQGIEHVEVLKGAPTTSTDGRERSRLSEARRSCEALAMSRAVALRSRRCSP